MPRMTTRRAGRPLESASGPKTSITIRLTKEQMQDLETITLRREIPPSASQMIGWLIEREARNT